MSSPRSGGRDKPLERVKKAIQDFRYENLLELYDPDSPAVKYEKDKVTLTRLGGTNIGIFRASYRSESKRRSYFILRMLPNEPFRRYYTAIRNELDDALFLATQYDTQSITINDRDYLLEIIEDCGENSSLDQFFTKTQEYRSKTNRAAFGFACAQSILNMMQELLALGYVYTDVKPSNFLVTNRSHIVVTDIKSIKKIKKETHNKDKIETTPIYQSYAWSQLKVDRVTTADLLKEISYRVGITLYEITSGHLVTDHCRQMLLDANNKAGLSLSNYKALASTLMSADNSLKEALEGFDQKLSAYKKSILKGSALEENVARTAYNQELLYLSCKAESHPAIGKLLRYLETHIAAIRDQTDITSDQFIRLYDIPQNTAEEKALHNIISKLLEPNSSERMSLQEANNYISTFKIMTLPSKEIPALSFSDLSSTNSLASNSTSPHSPSAITPNSSSSSKVSAQSAPPGILRHSLSSNAFLLTSMSQSRDRSSTICGGDNAEAPTTSRTSPKRSKSKYQLHFIHRQSSKTLFDVEPRDKKRSSTFASSSSAPNVTPLTGRPRSNTEIHIVVEETPPSPNEQRKNHRAKKGIQITPKAVHALEEEPNDSATLKSSSAPALTNGQYIRRR